jgi:hypothetical protein
MGTFLPNGFAQVRFVFQCTGVLDQMGFGWACEAELGQDAQTIAETHTNAYNGNVWDAGDAASQDYTWVSTEVTLETGTGPVVAIDSVNSPGTSVQAVAPPNLAMLVTKQTALGGRTNRGRFYHPAAIIFESGIDAAGNQSVGNATFWTSAFNAMSLALILDNLKPVLLHTNPAQPPTDISGFSVATLMATQRRRMR